jgi:hypothetical protein
MQLASRLSLASAFSGDQHPPRKFRDSLPPGFSGFSKIKVRQQLNATVTRDSKGNA